MKKVIIIVVAVLVMLVGSALAVNALAPEISKVTISGEIKFADSDEEHTYTNTYYKVDGKEMSVTEYESWKEEHPFYAMVRGY